MQGVAILGSTGSIGVNTLDIVRRHPDRFRVVALAAQSRHEALLGQCREFRPECVALASPEAAGCLRQALQAEGLAIPVLEGPEGLLEVARHPGAQQVMAAIVGAAGLRPTLAAAEAGKRLLLANKEALVCAGELLMAAVERSGAMLLPIDSEHNAIFQCLPPGVRPGSSIPGMKRLLLTASGGPFRQWSAAQMAEASPAQAVAHPNWSMGQKISVDSASMMNKGLEIIEACWLFRVEESRVEVVVHPQSIVHSMVEYDDGSVLAQLGQPDMRTPIANAMAWPDRIASGVQSLDLAATAALEFEPPDPVRFPCLRLAREAAQRGGTAPVVLNAANEVAVAAFLEGKLNFPGIATVIDRVLQGHAPASVHGLEDVLEADRQGRDLAARAVSGA